MNVFLVYIRDASFCQLLTETLAGSRRGDDRVKVVAFPRVGIETLAPVIRRHGRRVRVFDTCHPRLKAVHIARTLGKEDVV
jgi:hypothetical protein